jgi:hypothetical protein
MKNNLTNLLKARKNLDAKIAAAKATALKNIKVGDLVTIKNHTYITGKDKDDVQDWVENRYTDAHYNQYGYIKFKVVGVNEKTIRIFPMKNGGNEQCKYTVPHTAIRTWVKKPAKGTAKKA